MSRNDEHHPLPGPGQPPLEQAFSIFVQRARQENRNYFGDVVRENLRDYLASGLTPQGAVDALFQRCR